MWWDASPVCFTAFKASKAARYPEWAREIDPLLPNSQSNYYCGITGATTNPRLINAALFERDCHWAERIRALDGSKDITQLRREIYNQLVLEGAAKLETMWRHSAKRYGWLSAQVDPHYSEDVSAMVEHGLELSRLAPNIMIKVPGSQAGYRAIEQLVAQGCSVNNTFCFTVSQFSAGLDAIECGRARAVLAGINVAHARYVITFMMGRYGAEDEFDRQANCLGISLSTADKRWAELAIYDAIQVLLASRQTPVRLLLSSIKLDPDDQEGEQCWHLERTGERTTLYTLPAPIIEFLLRRQRAGRPVLPARSLQIPNQVLDKLLRIDYFTQAFELGGVDAVQFSRHPAFITAHQYACEARPELEGFIESVRTRLPVGRRPMLQAQTGAWS